MCCVGCVDAVEVFVVKQSFEGRKFDSGRGREREKRGERKTKIGVHTAFVREF